MIWINYCLYPLITIDSLSTLPRFLKIFKISLNRDQLYNLGHMDNVCEEEVYSSLFRANSKTVFNYIYYKFGNEEKAYDVVQEAFIKLWENCAKVSPEKAKSFVYTVANNLYLNLIKAEKVRQKYAADSKKAISHESPEFLLEEQEYKEKLDRALASLPDNQRTVFLLSRIDGKKYAEIAEMEGVSVKAIEKRMHLALKTLRDQIAGI